MVISTHWDTHRVVIKCSGVFKWRHVKCLLWAHNVYDARQRQAIWLRWPLVHAASRQKDNDTELLPYIRCGLLVQDYFGFPHCVYRIISALCTRREVTKQEAEKHVCTLKHWQLSHEVEKEPTGKDWQKSGITLFWITLRDDNAVTVAMTELSFHLLY